MAARRVRKRTGRLVAADAAVEGMDDGAMSAEELRGRWAQLPSLPGDGRSTMAPEDVAMEDADGSEDSNTEECEDGEVVRDDGKEEEDEDADEEDDGAPVARGHARRRLQARKPRVLRGGDRPRHICPDLPFKLHIYQVLKQADPDRGISKRGMDMMNTFVEDVFATIMGEAATLTHHQRKSTMTHREVIAAAKRVLGGGFGTLAEVEALKALELSKEDAQPARPVAGGDGGRGKKKKKRAGKTSARCGKR